MAKFDPEEFSKRIFEISEEFQKALEATALHLNASAAIMWMMQGNVDEAKRVLSEMELDGVMALSIAAQGLSDLADDTLRQQK